MIDSPFPFFGSKRKVARLVWKRFGQVDQYREPFFGSGAILLGRPKALMGGLEVVNDLNCFVSNFFRAVKHVPDEVAAHADYPSSEVDQYSRHCWLMKQAKGLRTILEADPDACDAKIAGWWAWGMSTWIGHGWCSKEEPGCQIPKIGFQGTQSKRRCENGLSDYFRHLSTRLSDVIVCCGDWFRIVDSPTALGQGMVAVFLDPPYGDDADCMTGRDAYGAGDGEVATKVREWCIEHGDNKRLRLALCGYEGEHIMPNGWACIKGKASGGGMGYGNQNKSEDGYKNSGRERIWFSPHCLKEKDGFFSFEETQ